MSEQSKSQPADAESTAATFVEIPDAAAPYVADACFLKLYGGWKRILDTRIDCESDRVFVICGDPVTGEYESCFETWYSETAHIIGQRDTLHHALLEDCRNAEPADGIVDDLLTPRPRAGVQRLLEGIPAEHVEIEGAVWERERLHSQRFRWVQPLDGGQIDWDPDEDDVSLVGTDTPIRVVTLTKRDRGWHVEALETAGPKYHRPGYTELISGDHAASATDPEEAVEAVERFLEELS